MSIAAMNWAWHQKLKPVLMALAEAAGREFLATDPPIVQGPLAERLVDIRNRARQNPPNRG